MMAYSVISGAVEGSLDEAILRCLAEHAGASLARVYGKKGKAYLRQRLHGYNLAARFSPWIVLVDLDQDEQCAPPLRRSWLPYPASNMCLRVAVRKVEAWILADREGVARFLGVPVVEIPESPDRLSDPKQTLVDLARRSKRRQVRDDMAPRPGSGRSVGPAYSSRVTEFVQTGWRPAVAERNSDSLYRCRKRLLELLEQ